MSEPRPVEQQVKDLRQQFALLVVLLFGMLIGYSLAGGRS